MNDRNITELGRIPEEKIDLFHLFLFVQNEAHQQCSTCCVVYTSKPFNCYFIYKMNCFKSLHSIVLGFEEN